MNTHDKKYNYFSSTEKKIAIFLFIVLFIFLIIRAIYVPVLHDEIATFFYYIQSDNYMPPAAHWDANNHVLNSMLANITYHLFGSSPLSLRLPNVLFYALFFFSSYKIAARLQTKTIRWGLFLALTCSHYYFEYFGECRGYGISIALFAAAIYQLIKVFETDKRKNWAIAILFLFLATSANLTLIIPSVLLFGILFIYLLIKYLKTNKKRAATDVGILFITALPFLLLVKQSFVLKNEGALYYGGHNGFYDITVSSVTKVFTDFYNLPIALLITTIFCGIIGYGLFQLFKHKSIQIIIQLPVFFSVLLVASVLSILVLSYGLEVNFPEDRAAMYLFLLLATSFAFILNDLAKKHKGVVFGSVLLFYFPVLFLFHATPTGSIFSTEERTSYPIFEYINNAEQDFKFPVTVGGYKTQEFCWYYLNNRAGGNQGKIHTNFHITLDADFQIVRDGKIKDSTLFNYYTPVLSDPDTKLTLFERNNRLKKQLIYHSPIQPTNGFVSDEYHNIIEFEIDSLIGEALYIGTELTLDTKEKPFTSWLAATINDAEGNSLYQEYIPLDWIKKDWNGTENNLLQGTILHDIPAEAKIIKFFIWNIDKTSFFIPNGKCYLYRLERDFPNQ